MKPLFTQTLAWIAAVLTALLFALNAPESQSVQSPFEAVVPAGGVAPR